MRLTPKDEKVIQAFYEQTSAESKKLYTDGKVLDGLWMGGNAIAEWEGRKIKFNDLEINFFEYVFYPERLLHKIRFKKTS